MFAAQYTKLCHIFQKGQFDIVACLIFTAPPLQSSQNIAQTFWALSQHWVSSELDRMGTTGGSSMTEFYAQICSDMLQAWTSGGNVFSVIELEKKKNFVLKPITNTNNYRSVRHISMCRNIITTENTFLDIYFRL